MMSKPTYSLILFSLISVAWAAVQSSTFSIDDADYTLSLNVPSPAQDNDLFFRLVAAADPSWVAFGFGTQMAGSLIFVTYSSADDNNVTVSPRLGVGHVMPEHTSDVNVEVLSGSGIVDGNYVVNAKCTNCRSWDDGKIDIKSTQQPMIYAVGPSGDIESNDLDASIQQHVANGFFSLNLVKATGPGGVPPPSPDEGGFGDGFDDNGESIGRRVHGTFMVGAFLVGFPLGYLFLRVFERVWIHAGIQSLAALAVLLGMGAGIALSIKQSISPHLNAYHQLIGFVVVAFVAMTWSAGFFGHRLYNKTGVPSLPTKIHRIIGPFTAFFGLVNCAIGFHFAGNNGGVVGFVVVTTFMIIFVSTMVTLNRRRKNRLQAFNTPAAQNFRQGQMEPQYSGTVPQDGVPLQPYGGRPQPYSLPSYQSETDQPPRYA